MIKDIRETLAKIIAHSYNTDSGVFMYSSNEIANFLLATVIGEEKIECPECEHGHKLSPISETCRGTGNIRKKVTIADLIKRFKND